MEHGEKKEERLVGDRVRDVVKAINDVFGLPLLNAATVPELLLDMPKTMESSKVEAYAIDAAFHALCEGADNVDPEVGRLHEIILQFGDRERPVTGTVGLLFAIADKRTPEQHIVFGREWIKDDVRLPRLFKAVRSYILAVREAPGVAVLREFARGMRFDAFLGANALLVSDLFASAPKEVREVVLARFREAVSNEKQPPTEDRTREIFAEASKS